MFINNAQPCIGMKSKAWWALLKLILGIAIIILLVYRIGAGEILHIILSTNPLVFIVILVAYALNWLMNAFSYFLILSSVGSPVNYPKMLRAFISSWGIGTVIPGKLGDTSIIYFLKRHGASIRNSGVMYIADKGAVFMFYMLSALMAAYMLLPANAYAVIIAFAAFILLMLLFFWLGPNITKCVFRKYDAEFRLFHAALKGVMLKKPLLMVCLTAISAVRWLVLALSFWVLFLMSGQQISLFHVFLISVTINIFALIPFTISGMGFKESASVYLYGLIGVSAGIVMAVSLIYSFATLAIALLAILVMKNE